MGVIFDNNNQGLPYICVPCLYILFYRGRLGIYLKNTTYSSETKQIVANLRIIDDDLFRLMAEKPDVCQEILRTLLDMPSLKVIKVNSQDLIQSFNREIILDALCEMDNGALCNIEVQKGKSNNDVARTRFHASAITAKYTPKSTDFNDIPDVTIVYITEYDALKNNQTITHVSRCMKNNSEYVPVNDGEDIVFANTCIDDGSDKSELLQLMLNKEAFYNDKFPAISKAITYFKTTKGGQAEMCKTVEEYAKEYAEKKSSESRIQMISDFLSSGGSESDAYKMLKATPEEVAKAKQSLIKH